MAVLESRSKQAPKDVEFLKGLKPQDIDLILAAGQLQRFSAKHVMTHQGETAGQLLLLWRGRARYFFETENGKKLNLHPIPAGLMFGGAALVSGSSSYLLSSEAIQDSVALVWQGSTIRTLAGRFPLLVQNALVLALDHLSWYTSAYAALASRTARERLARVLLTLAPRMGQKVPGGIELRLTNEELADSAIITHYTASRMLGQWKKNGAIGKQHGKILLRSPERLLLRGI